MSQVGKHSQWEGAGRGKLDLFLCDVNLYIHSMYMFSVVTVSGFA